MFWMLLMRGIFIVAIQDSKVHINSFAKPIDVIMILGFYWILKDGQQL